MINACYGINEYIQAKVTASGRSTGNFYPGRFAPQSETSKKFVTYFVTPGDVYDLHALRSDQISYVFYNTSFEDLHNIVDVVMNSINVHNIQDTSLAEYNILYKDVWVRFGNGGEAELSEGTQYYFIPAVLTVQYSVLNTYGYGG